MFPWVLNCSNIWGADRLLKELVFYTEKSNARESTALEVLVSRWKYLDFSQWKISDCPSPQDEEGEEGGARSQLWQRSRISRTVRMFPEESVSLYVSRILPHRATHCYFCLHRWESPSKRLFIFQFSKVTNWVTDVQLRPVENPPSQNTLLMRPRPLCRYSSRRTPSSCQRGAKFPNQGPHLLPCEDKMIIHHISRNEADSCGEAQLSFSSNSKCGKGRKIRLLHLVSYTEQLK